MFKIFLGKNQDTENTNKQALIVDKVSKMNLTDMRAYVNNRLKDFEITEDGLVEVMNKLTQEDKISGFYLKIDDMDSKKKKAFDLVILIGKSKKISIRAVEIIQEFSTIYEDIIQKFDNDFKEIYKKRFKDIMQHSLGNLNEIEELRVKMNILGD